MLRVILIAVAIVIVGILAYASTLPNSFKVERRITIKATPDKVFALLNDFNRWSAWSPWEKLDPAMQRSFGNITSGQGAVYEWKGNSKVGEGRMEVTQSTPTSQLIIKLDFLKPFEAHNVAQFDLQPQGDSTEVVWSMSGPNLFIGKIMQVFVSMDKMVGKDFATGLANLKALAES